jgi:hypothetical protein
VFGATDCGIQNQEVGFLSEALAVNKTLKSLILTGNAPSLFPFSLHKS